MRSTGIVRRIDDLGRVVIPKEIRRTMRIKDGDPLEIYTDNDGEVIFKKYSPLGELGTLATQYAEVLHHTGGHPVLVCDSDRVIAVAGLPKKELLERRISADLEDRMERRATFVITQQGEGHIDPVEGLRTAAFVGAPIIVDGDVCGYIMFLGNSTATEADEKLIRTAAAFLGKQME